MNEHHLRLCASPEWARHVEEELLPWALSGRHLGDDVLEVGPGPGLTTHVLPRQVARLTVVKIDEQMASNLTARLADSRVTLVRGDATDLPFDAGRFSAVTSFAMLHHVASSKPQDRVLRKLRRQLRPGGLLVGSDAIDTPELRELHVSDTFVPLDPATLAARLEAAGLEGPVIEGSSERLRLLATASAITGHVAR